MGNQAIHRIEKKDFGRPREKLPYRDQEPSRRGNPGRYALILPARNEAGVIHYSLDSVVRQTVTPVAVVVALNDCTDATAEVVEPYLRRYPWISLIRRNFGGDRNFGNKARVFSEAFDLVSNLRPEFIGNLDADVTLPTDFYERLMLRFQADPRLGIAGGRFFELREGKQIRHFDENEVNVGGVVQMFRVVCYREIGGYLPIKTGGIDMAADVMARHRGWKTVSFPELRFQHHRSMGTAEAELWAAKYREGVRDYHLGYGFVFHGLKCIRRIPESPFVLGSLARLSGYCREAVKGKPQGLPPEEQDFLRAEQRTRIFRPLKEWVRTVLRFFGRPGQA